MPRVRATFAGIALSAALIAGSLIAAPTAQAAESDRPAPVTVNVAETHPEVTPKLVDQAISDARAAGAVTGEQVHSDGTRTVTISAGDGASLELNATSPRQRLSAGNDSYGGLYVAFNSYDQGLILAGAGAALTAGLCLISVAVCVVATVAITIAGHTIASNGAVQCGKKSLRVYPQSQKKPRCA